MNSLHGKASRGSAFLAAMGLVLAGPVLVGHGQANAAPAPKAGDLTDAEINRSLDFLAKRLAAATDGADLRKTIQGAVGKRFDGDEEALWSSLAVDPAFSRRVAGSSQSPDVIVRAAAKMPRLQIAVPVHFDSWDPATYAPLVGYFPEGVDDTQVKTITAYDAAGNAVPLDAQVAPKRPVIVLGLNERTDEQGRLLEQSVTSSPTTQTAEYSAASGNYKVDVVKVHLINDNESWALGDAEISMKARSRGCSGVEYSDTNWSNLNHDDDWWNTGTPRNVGYSGCDVVFYWWEDDGGSFDFTLGYKDFSLGVKMDNSDDLIGGVQVLHSTFEGSSSTMTGDWSALDMWTQ